MLSFFPCLLRQVVANLRRAAAKGDDDGNAEGGGGLERMPSISDQANPYFTDHTPRMPTNANRITFADKQLPTQQIPFKFPGRDVEEERLRSEFECYRYMSVCVRLFFPIFSTYIHLSKERKKERKKTTYPRLALARRNSKGRSRSSGGREHESQELWLGPARPPWSPY